MIKLQIAVSLALAVLLALEITLAYFYLLDSGSEFSVTLQENSNIFFDILWWVSFLLTIPLLTKIKLILFYFYSPSKGMELVILSVAVDVIGNLLKLMIAYPRPFWYSEDVIAKTCSFSFGDPSMHTMLTVSVLTYAVWRMEKKSYFYGIVAGYVLVVCFERVYGGVHTYSQVILGAFIGLYFVFMFWQHHESVRESIKELKTSPISKRSVVLGLVSICLALLLYFVRSPWWDDDWDSNAEEHCEEFDSEKALQAQFLECIFIFYYYGAAWAYHLVKTTGIKLKRTTRWQKALIMVGCLGSHIGCKFIKEFSVGAFEGDVFLVTFTDFIEGFLCYGGVCLPFDCLRKEKSDEKTSDDEDPDKVKLVRNEGSNENLNN